MNTNELTIGLELFVVRPQGHPARLTHRFALGCAISALPRSVGDRRHHVCVLSASGEIIAEEVLPNTRECLSAYAARYPGATFIMETGTHCSPCRPPAGTRTAHPPLRSGLRHLHAAALRRRGSPACWSSRATACSWPTPALAVTLLALWKSGADYEAIPLPRAA